MNHKVSNLVLTGKKILITRAKAQSSSLAFLLQEAGATPFFLPLIEMKPRMLTERIRDLLSTIEQFDWIVFTSSNGVHSFFSLFDQVLVKPSLAVVGRKTAFSLNQFTNKTPFIPRTFHAEALAKELAEYVKNEAKVLIVKGQLVDQTLAMKLEEAGASVQELVVYDTLMPQGALADAKELQSHLFDYVTLTSASTANHLAKVMETSPLQYRCVACIGPITAKAANQQGLSSIITANEYSAEGLTHAIVQEENVRWN